jgi:hypothetical protein
MPQRERLIMLNTVWLYCVAFLASKQWMPVAILIIGYLVRLTSSACPLPVTVPARWRPVLVVALSELYSTLGAVQSGAPWHAALLHGFETAVWTMGLFDIVVNAVWGGNEPAWLAALLGIVQQEVPRPDGKVAHVNVPVMGKAPESHPAVDPQKPPV